MRGLLDKPPLGQVECFFTAKRGRVAKRSKKAFLPLSPFLLSLIYL
jgi:hypothetical protein